MNRSVRWWVFSRTFGWFAFVYAITAISRCALYGVNLTECASQRQKYEALVHLLLWTFGPPVWFLADSDRGQTDLSYGQKLASGIWAAVFATILVLVKP